MAGNVLESFLLRRQADTTLWSTEQGGETKLTQLTDRITDDLSKWFLTLRTSDDLLALPEDMWCPYGPVARALIFLYAKDDRRSAQREMERMHWVGAETSPVARERVNRVSALLAE